MSTTSGLPSLLSSLQSSPLFSTTTTNSRRSLLQNPKFSGMRGSLLILPLLLFLSIHTFPAVDSAVLSIDIGSEWLKVAVVNLKPGQTPISVAINEMSKRKSPALVAFAGGNRLVGEEAAGITARYPDKVYSLVRDMIGKPYGYVKNALDSMYLPFDLVEDERGAVGIRVDGGVVYTVEELMAMVLKYAVGLAELHAKMTVKDAVVTVPAYFGQAERKGMLMAAQLAGINVLALINEHSGAALQYGIDKDFSNESRHVVFYDMGAGSTYAALVYFSAYKAKEYGKTVSVNQFQVKDVRWNTKLGGQQMELRLVEYFADEFNSQFGDGIDIRKSPKAMAKLKKQVKRTKEILSANTVALISVESLYDDRDFRSTITREKFEELCGDLWDRALDPLKEVIQESGLKLEEVHAVELIGGATRMPKLQNKLQEFIGRKDLDKHLDADEAIVLGSALHAANLSDGIKLNRKLGMIDGSPYGFTVEFDDPELVNQENVEPVLVPRMKKLGSKTFRSINHNRDFGISLNYEGMTLPPGVSSKRFVQFAVLGLTEASEKHSTRNLSSPIKANLHFTLSRSGIISLDRAEAVIEYFEWVEITKKKLSIENSTASASTLSEGDNKNSTEEINKSLNLENETSSSATQNLEGQLSSESATEKKLKKKTFRVPLKIVDKTLGPGITLSKESLSEAKARLETLDQKDKERRRTAELKNNLEEYIYATREKLEDSDDIHKILAESERKSFIAKLDEAQEWLYTDGEDASATEFLTHLDSLKSVGDPIFLRLSELTALPAACEHARNYLSGVDKIVSDWEKNKPWIPKARIEKILSEVGKVNKWLDEKETLHKKTSPFSTPALTSDEVSEKILDLQDEVASVNRIPKPKPKIEKPSKDEHKDEKKSKDENKGSSNTTDDDTNAPDEPAEEIPSSANSEEVEAGADELHDEL